MSSGLQLSQDPIPTPETDELPAPVAVPKGSLAGLGLWARVGLAVFLLAASATGRAWQAKRVDQVMRDGRISPFPLAEIPMTLGSWVGKDIPLDPIIARATGSVDHIQRMYQNTITGQRIELIFLYGPSSQMFIHAPDVCYPGSGFEHIAGPIGHDITSGDGGHWPFFEVIYRKGEGNTADQQEVYYSWRHFGALGSSVWSPGMITQKRSERIPGMFKVQVARGIKDRELGVRDVGNPCQAFLAQLMPEIERRVATPQSPARSTP
jgi:Protein of unknown function (DUF3485)